MSQWPIKTALRTLNHRSTPDLLTQRAQSHSRRYHRRKAAHRIDPTESSWQLALELGAFPTDSKDGSKSEKFRTNHRKGIRGSSSEGMRSLHSERSAYDEAFALFFPGQKFRQVLEMLWSGLDLVASSVTGIFTPSSRSVSWRTDWVMSALGACSIKG